MSSRVLKIGECSVDEGKHCIVKGGQTTKIEPRDFGVLEMLIARAPDLVSNDAIMSHVWQNKVVGDNVLYQSVGRLRRALGDSARQPTYIETLAKRGYRLIAPMSVVSGTQLRTVELAPIAVLPFRNYSGELLNPGFSESLGFEVGQQFMDRAIDVLNFDHHDVTYDDPSEFAVAENAGASTLVTGSIIANQDSVRVLVSLSDVGSQLKLWSARYDLKLVDMFDVQSLLGKTIVDDLCAKFVDRFGPRAAVEHRPVSVPSMR